jgi:putative spermidine/putrescine transport system permease protein
MTSLRGHGWLLGPGLVLLATFFLVPVGIIFEQGLFDPAFTTAHFDRFASRGAYLAVFLNTLRVSAIVAAACLVIGYPVAYFIVRQPASERPLLLFLVLVPLWMSILVRTYAWMVVLGREGIVNGLLIWVGVVDQPVKLMFTTGAVYVGMVQILLPIMIVTCFSAMTEIDQGLVRAARVLGARPRQAFARVFLPLSLEGAVTGAVIVFILSMGFFITPALIGGRKDAMMANLIAGQVSQANWAFASALAIILLFATLAVMMLVRLAARRLVYSAAAGAGP